MRDVLSIFTGAPNRIFLTRGGSNLDAYAILGLEPPLVLDFDESYFRTGGTATDLVSAATHTRASSATYVDADGILQTAAINEPRVGHHIWDGSAWVDEGYFHESEARTNLIENSQDFDAGSYVGIASIVVPSYADSPIGSNAATRLIDDNAGGTGTVGWADAATIVTVSTTYTFWAILKKDQLSWAYLETRSFTTPNNVQTYFDLENGIVGTVGAGHTAHMKGFGNGWYLCGITFTTDVADTSGQPRVYASSANATPSVDRDGTSSILMAAWQFEQGSTPSSYIPTAGATVTRAADAMTIPAANLPWPTPEVIGPELVTNGTFDTDTDWTKGTGWTISGGQASHVAGSATLLYQTTSLTLGKVYKASCDVVSISGGTGALQFRVGGTTTSVTLDLDKVGTTVEVLYVADGNTQIAVFAGSGTNITIDNISVREINPLAVSIQMEGTMTYADEGVVEEVVFVNWRAGVVDYIRDSISTLTTRTGESNFVQRDTGSGLDVVTSSTGYYSPGINVPFNIASRHGATFINGAVDGTALTANTTPTALPDLVTSDFRIGPDFNGTIKLVRVWADDLTDEGIEDGSSNV